MTPLVIIRPQPGCDATLSAATAMQLDARGFPLFTVSPMAWDPPDPDTIDALLIGSANSLRHGGDGLQRFIEKPVYAVGRATADIARDAGFTIAAVGDGQLQPVLDRIDPAHRRLLRLAGLERVNLSPPPSVTISERVLYACNPRPISQELAEILAFPAVVMLHSAVAAQHFAAECKRLNLSRERIALAAIGPRVADAAGIGWQAVKAAKTPNDTALLALAHDMCQNRAGSSAE